MADYPRCIHLVSLYGMIFFVPLHPPRSSSLWRCRLTPSTFSSRSLMNASTAVSSWLPSTQWPSWGLVWPSVIGRQRGDGVGRWRCRDWSPTRSVIEDEYSQWRVNMIQMHTIWSYGMGEEGEGWLTIWIGWVLMYNRMIVGSVHNIAIFIVILKTLLFMGAGKQAACIGPFSLFESAGY